MRPRDRLSLNLRGVFVLCALAAHLASAVSVDDCLYSCDDDDDACHNGCHLYCPYAADDPAHGPCRAAWTLREACYAANCGADKNPPRGLCVYNMDDDTHTCSCAPGFSRPDRECAVVNAHVECGNPLAMRLPAAANFSLIKSTCASTKAGDPSGCTLRCDEDCQPTYSGDGVRALCSFSRGDPAPVWHIDEGGCDCPPGYDARAKWVASQQQPAITQPDLAFATEQTGGSSSSSTSSSGFSVSGVVAASVGGGCALIALFGYFCFKRRGTAPSPACETTSAADERGAGTVPSATKGINDGDALSRSRVWEAEELPVGAGVMESAV